VPLDEHLDIDTPEQIRLELPIAGIGSRFLAVVVDTVLQIALALAALLTLTFGVPGLGSRALESMRVVGAALTILFAFCVYWGYFAFFEFIWSGRTPGKRLAGIRVIKESGRPINAYEAIGRNVVRAIDFLPGMYGVGVVVMMLNRSSRRLGDYVAGTIVVHDKQTEDVALDWHATSRTTAPLAPAARLPAEELVLIETYLHRRAELDPLVREQMAGQVAGRITKKTGRGPEPGQTLDEFLEVTARQIRDTAGYR
jgi:uncharacterized RDD family membrane protein YckC